MFEKVIGIGGIGTGLLFHSSIAETLGRNESRLANLSDAKDYCKQHIVLHYTAVLSRDNVRVLPIGFVGDDAAGRQLISEMELSGMDTRYVGKSRLNSTMLSICLQYPNKDCCNITSINSAGIEVDETYTRACLTREQVNGLTMLAVIPEAPLESRLAMLRYGRDKASFNALSVTSAEAREFLESDAFYAVDLLAVNCDEANALTGVADALEPTTHRLYEMLKKWNSRIMLLVTDGKNGAISVFQDHFERVSSMPVDAVNTTGAGDACLGGVLAGLALDLPFQKGWQDSAFGSTPLFSAVELGIVCAGMAVEISDTIATHVCWESIHKRLLDLGLESRQWPTS